MANEISLTASLSGNKAAVMSSAVSRSVTAALFNMAGNYVQQGVFLVPTAGAAVPLGAVTAPHWSAFHNLDAANYLTLRNGVSGADLIKLLAGEWAFVPLPDTAVPYGVANVAACLLEYLIFSL